MSSAMENLLEAVRFLAEPFDSNHEGAVKTADSTESLWMNMCQKVWDKIDISPTCRDQINHQESSSSWKLTCTILDVLKQLKCQVEEIEKNQSEEENSIETLSIQSQLCITKCLELVVGFGILPNLIPGVGIPNKFRKTNTENTNFMAADTQTRQFVQFQRLAHCLENLLLLCTYSSFLVIIIPRHLNDILSGLIQVCKAPIKDPRETIQKPETSKGGSAGGLTIEEFTSAKSVRETLESLMLNTFSPLVARRIWVHSLLLIGAVKKPKWFGVAANKLLHEALLEEKSGLLTVTQSVLEMLGNTSKWEASKVISNLVRAAYVDLSSEGDYEVLINLSKQCLNMITSSLKQKSDCEGAKGSINQEWLRVGLFCGITLTSLNKEITHQIMWDSLFKPVLSLSQFFGGNLETHSTVEEVNQCTTVAMELLATCSPMGVTFEVNDFQPLWSLLLQILAATSRFLKLNTAKSLTFSSVSQLNIRIRVLIVHLIEVAVKNVAENSNMSIFDFFMDLMVRQMDVLKIMEIECCETDGDSSLESTAVSWKVFSRRHFDSRAKTVLEESCTVLTEDILFSSQFKHSKMIQDLLTQLLSFQTSLPKTVKEILVISASTTGKETAEGSPKDSNARRASFQEAVDEVRLMAHKATVAQTLLDSIGTNVDIVEKFFNEQQADPFEFLDMLIENISKLSIGNESIVINETVVPFFAILENLCQTTWEGNERAGGVVITDTDKWNKLESFLPYLENFLKDSSRLSASMILSAENILKCIKSRGQYSDFSGRTQKEPLVELSAYKKALVDVECPLVYIKGHGLLTLRKLLEEKDEETLEHEENLLEIFQTELINDDSYVYLMAIEGMAALGSRFHKVVVPRLINLYDFPALDAPIEGQECVTASSSRGSDRRSKMTDSELIEYRLKVGEILVKLIQRLGGEIAPLYRAAVANVCFRLVRDEDATVKASALANLGELCYILKFALGNILAHVWECVENMLETEKEVQVRRAGYHLMVLLLRGIAQELEVEFLVQNRDVGLYLRDAQRLLIKMKKTETDEASQCHIELALVEIAMIVAKFFMLSPQTPNEH